MKTLFHGILSMQRCASLQWFRALNLLSAFYLCIIPTVCDAQRFALPIQPPDRLVRAQVMRVELSDVKKYATTATNNIVVATGTIVGNQSAPFPQLILGDSKGNYIVVTISRVAAPTFIPILSSLTLGDTVEVTGIAGTIQGTLKTSPNGATIEVGAATISNTPSYGTVDLTDLTRVK